MTETADRTRALVLAYLAGECPRGVLLDYLKEQGLIPDGLGEPREPARVHVRWMIGRDIAEVLACEPADGSGWDEAEIAARAAQRTCILVVAELGQRVVGYLAYDMLRSALQVAHLVVHPDFRRRGVGRALLGWMQRRFERHAYSRDRITAHAYPDNVAGTLFLDACGFRPVEVLPVGYLVRFEWRPEAKEA